MNNATKDFLERFANFVIGPCILALLIAGLAAIAGQGPLYHFLFG